MEGGLRQIQRAASGRAALALSTRATRTVGRIQYKGLWAFVEDGPTIWAASPPHKLPITLELT